MAFMAGRGREVEKLLMPPTRSMPPMAQIDLSTRETPMRVLDKHLGRVSMGGELGGGADYLVRWMCQREEI